MKRDLPHMGADLLMAVAHPPNWAINLPHGATITIGRGTISVRQGDGCLVIYRLPMFGALVIGPITTKGRRMELRL